MNYDLVLHIDSKEENMMKMVLRNANNYLKALPEKKFEVVVVANGGGVVHFTLDNKEFEKAGLELSQKGVQFKLCANALADHKLTKEQMWPICEVVPAGLVEIVRLQRAAFAYIKP